MTDLTKLAKIRRLQERVAGEHLLEARARLARITKELFRVQENCRRVDEALINHLQVGDSHAFLLEGLSS